jgi:hypothetical protein
MNIVIIGAGKPGKFGGDFAAKAQSDGHDVKTMSHMTALFSDIDNVVNRFNLITKDLDRIDLLLYNSNYKGHPDNTELFTSRGSLNDKLYSYGFNVHVLVPHAICIEALKKMDKQSKIVFMTTDVIYDRERQENLQKLSYYGGKAYQHQLMLGFAEHNDKDAIVSSVSPYFDYNDSKNYKRVFDIVYSHILNHDATQNGKVFDCWE